MMRDWMTLPLRGVLGIVFIAHGLQKAAGLFGGPGIEGFSEMISKLGFAPPIFWAYLVAYIEFLGGICLLIGAFTRIASGLLFIVMLVAMLKLHLSNGFFLMQGGYEYTLVIMGACLSLIIQGGGKLSLLKKL
jgi:putative oxidoreductase